jgi:hypothetical protein
MAVDADAAGNLDLSRKECSMERRLHLLESFRATGSDGTIYKVCGYEHLVRDESLADGVDHWEPTGQSEYRLASGERIEVQPDGSLRISDTGVQLTPA